MPLQWKYIKKKVGSQSIISRMLRWTRVWRLANLVRQKPLTKYFLSRKAWTRLVSVIFFSLSVFLSSTSFPLQKKKKKRKKNDNSLNFYCNKIAHKCIFCDDLLVLVLSIFGFASFSASSDRDAVPDGLQNLHCALVRDGFFRSRSAWALSDATVDSKQAGALSRLN